MERFARVRRWALLAFAAACAVVAIRYEFRFGDHYRLGDGVYRRDTASDLLRVLVPGALATGSLLLLAQNLLTGNGLRAQWRREHGEHKAARAWSTRRTK